MSAMEIYGGVAAHPPSLPVSIASPVSGPSKELSPRGEKRREPSDDVRLDTAQQASPVRFIKKEKKEEMVNKDEQDKKEEKKREKEEKQQMNKIPKQKKQEQRMKRKLDKEKAIARALVLLRMPETVLDTDQKEYGDSTSRLAVPVVAASEAQQKKDDGNTSNTAIPDVQQEKSVGRASDVVVSDTAVPDSTMSDAVASDAKQKGNGGASNAAAPDAADSDAAVSDAVGFDSLMSNAYDSDDGSDGGRFQTPRFEGWSSPEPEDDDNDLGQLRTPTPPPPPGPAIKKAFTRYQDCFPHDYSSDESDGVADPDTDEFAVRLLATKSLRIRKQAASAGPATAEPITSGGPSVSPQDGNNNGTDTGTSTSTLNSQATAAVAAVSESALGWQTAAHRERRRLCSAEFDIVMVVVRDEMDKFAERMDIQDKDMLCLIRRVGSLEECADFFEEQWADNS